MRGSAREAARRRWLSNREYATPDSSRAGSKRGGAMKIEHLMSTDVITVRPDTSLKQVAETLMRHRISGAPVVNEQGTVLGVVSEADILAKERGPEAPRGGLVRRLLRDAESEKPAVRTAADAMSVPATTIGPSRDVSEAARLMLEQGIKRLPVVGPIGTLLGIVTRSDLVRAFARSDDEIENEIRDDLMPRTLWLDDEAIRVEVEGGEVTLSGEVARRTEAELLSLLVERVPGVVEVRSALAWRLDDLKVRVPRSGPRISVAPRAGD
jgi:CBS domain-containing protein